MGRYIERSEHIARYTKEIYLCFDNDEPGREASRRVAELFPPKKVHIVNLNLKDANDYLMQDKQKEFKDRIEF